MAYPITVAMSSLLSNSVHRFATLWTITRTDATVLRFTDNSSPLVYDGNTYTPVDGFNASARLKEDSLQARGFDVKGVLSATAIDHDDLRAGRYRDAEIDEVVVDSTYPFDAMLHQRYLVLETQFDGESWGAEIVGLSRRLRPKIGRLFLRDCDVVLGSAKCQQDISTWTVAAAVVTWVSASLPRKRFRAAALPNVAYFDYGKVLWTGAGDDNYGFVGETKTWVQADREVRLQLAMPFDIQIGDEFTIEPGCLKTPEHCKGTLGDGDRPWPSNIDNFQGFLTIPGTDTMMRTPRPR